MKIYFVSLLMVILLLPFQSHCQVNTIDSLEKLLPTSNDSLQYHIYLQLHNYSFYKNEALTHQYLNKAIAIAAKNRWKERESDAIMAKAIVFYNYNRPDSALKNYQHLLHEWDPGFDSIKLARLYGNLGNSYMAKSQYDSSLIYFLKAGNIFNVLKNKKGQGRVYGVIGVLYMSLKEYSKAEMYFINALNINDSIGNFDDATTSKLNLAIIYKRMEQYQKAIALDSICMLYYQAHNNPYYLAMAQTNLADCYRYTGLFEKAERNYGEASNIFISLNQYLAVAKNYSYLADLKTEQGNYSKAIEYLEAVLPFMDSLNDLEVKMGIYQDLSFNYKQIKNPVKALAYHEFFYLTYDSLQRINRQCKIDSLLTQFESEKMTKELVAQQKIIKTEKNLKFMLIGMVVMLLFLMGLLYSRFAIKKRAAANLSFLNKQITQQNEEISSQRDEIELQRNHIIRQNNLMKSGIQYASTIQSAVMPGEKGLNQYFTDSFVFFKPRDIVGGDFLFYRMVNDKIVVAVVDCSGHGVPGAFLSLLGISFLNEIVNRGINKADHILEQMRALLISTFIKKTNLYSDQESMVASVCVFDRKINQFEFAGAQSKAYFFHQGQLIPLKSGKMLIGSYYKNDPFTSTIYDYQPGDMVYLFTDGFADQIGGPENEKFMMARFAKMISDNAHQSMPHQFQTLKNEFDCWQGDNEQIDDVLVVGIRI